MIYMYDVRICTNQTEIYSIRSFVSLFRTLFILLLSDRAGERTSECVMKCEHGHNDLLFFTHKNTRTTFEFVIYIQTYILNFCPFYFAGHLQFNLNLLELLTISLTYTCHAPCSTGVQNHLSPNLWFSLVFFLFSVRCISFNIFHILSFAVCFSARTHSHDSKSNLCFFFFCNELFTSLCCC